MSLVGEVKQTKDNYDKQQVAEILYGDRSDSKHYSIKVSAYQIRDNRDIAGDDPIQQTEKQRYLHHIF